MSNIRQFIQDLHLIHYTKTIQIKIQRKRLQCYIYIGF